MARLIAKMRGPLGPEQLPPDRRRFAAIAHHAGSGERARGSHERPALGTATPTGFSSRCVTRGRPRRMRSPIAAAGIRRIVTLTLFPHWSKATTGSSRNEFDRALASPAWQRARFGITHIEHCADNPRAERTSSVHRGARRSRARQARDARGSAWYTQPEYRGVRHRGSGVKQVVMAGASLRR
jgi:hypothetical protein